MSMILNLGISENWVAINRSAVSFPAIMRIDYVRIYQREGEESVTCDPPGWETTEYIKNHAEAYTNPNHTVSTGHMAGILSKILITACTDLGRYWVRMAEKFINAWMLKKGGSVYNKCR